MITTADAMLTYSSIEQASGEKHYKMKLYSQENQTLHFHIFKQDISNAKVMLKNEDCVEQK